MNSKLQYLALLVICLCTFFANLGQHFPDIMESRNFISAREMIEHGNWWYTTLNLEPRLEKPPFPTWLTAITALLNGNMDNLFVLRIPSALAGLLMVWFFVQYLKSATSSKTLPFLGGAVMATSLLILEQARVNSWDIYPNAFMLGALWKLNQSFLKHSWKAAVWSGLLMALSILSKGPVSLYAVWLAFILAMVFGGQLYQLKIHWKKVGLALFIGLVVGFSWRIWVTLFQSTASEQIIAKEVTAWGGRHVRPFYFYLHFPLYIGIWMPFVLASFFPKFSAPKVNRFASYRFTIAWILIAFVLLSVIPTKKERYLLPVIIPMCFMVTYFLQALYEDQLKGRLIKWDKFLITAFSFLLFVPLILLPVLVLFQTKLEANLLSLFSSVFISASAIYGLWSWKRKELKGIFIALIASVCLFCVGLLPQGLEVFYDNPDFKNLSELKSHPKVQANPVFQEYDIVDPRVVWLIGKEVNRFSSEVGSDPSNYPMIFLSFGDKDEVIKMAEENDLQAEDLGTYDIFRVRSKWKVNAFYLKQ